jgi:hypothetical protein
MQMLLKRICKILRLGSKHMGKCNMEQWMITAVWNGRRSLDLRLPKFYISVKIIKLRLTFI